MIDFDWSTIIPNLPYLGEGMIITLKITFVTIIIGIIWGTLLALMGLAQNRIIRGFARGYVHLFRSIPLILVLMWFYFIVPQFIKRCFHLDPMTDISLASAMIAFSLFEAAYYAEIIRAGIKSVATGQMQAALALGLTRSQSMRYIILPQAFKAMVPLLLTQGIILFQDTSLVYVLSLADFFRSSLIIGQTSGTEIEMVLFAGVVYFVICFLASTCVNLLKKRNAS